MENDVHKYQIDKECDTCCKDPRKIISLHHACENNDNVATVSHLIEDHKYDPNGRDDQGNTLLHVAAENGCLDIIRYLVENLNCSTQCKNEWGRTPLHNACKRNESLAVVKYLIDEGQAEPNEKDNEGDTPVHMAAAKGSLDILRYLIDQKNCKLECKGEWGCTALHYACQLSGNIAMVKYLVEEKKCDVNCVDDYGFTPLDHATTFANKPVVHFLKKDVNEIQYMAPQTNLKYYPTNVKNQYFIGDEHGVPVKLNHPNNKEHLGPPLPGWHIFQKGTGDVVFFNTKNKATCDEDPRAAAERYDKALNEGYVKVHLRKVLVIGSCGVGKTHLLHLLFDEPLPEVRNSTPLMKRPVQAIMTAAKQTKTLERISDTELYELLATIVNGKFLSRPSMHFSQDTASLEWHTNSATSNKESAYINQEASLQHEPQFNTQSFHVSEVAEQLIPKIANSKTKKALLDIEWIYFIDSGGQPQFHQLLPAFIHNTTLNIFVLRLCDKLDERPTVDYYKNGLCHFSFPSLLSNREILQHCAQATQTIDGKGKSRLLIAGTHRDLEHQCNGETRNDKDRCLLELLKPSLKKHLLYSKKTGDSLIFPLDARNPDEDDRKVIKEIIKSILNIKMDKPVEIPLRWLVFHQELHTLSKKNDTELLSLEECSQIARRLHMSEDVKVALRFLADLNVILYYDFFPNVVFTNVQVIVDVITRVIESIASKRTDYEATDNNYMKACTEGIISAELFEDCIFKVNIFEAQDLIHILLSLKIICKLRDTDEYFMPSILGGLSENDIQRELSSSQDTILPIAIHFKDRWLKCGEFSSLITSLLMCDEFVLAYKGHKLLSVYSNCIKMVYHTCLVTFIDAVSHIEIHLNANDLDTCKSVCLDIKKHISGVMDSAPAWDYICPCTNFKKKHLTKLDAKYTRFSCSENPCYVVKTSDLGPEFDAWHLTTCNVTEEVPPHKKRKLQGEQDANVEAFHKSTTLDLNSVDNELEKVIKWKVIGQNLGIEDHILADIESNKMLIMMSEMKRAMLKWWLNNDKDASWDKLARALDGVYDQLAKQIRSRYCGSGEK